MTIQDRADAIREQVRQAAEASGRDASEITVVAVSKTFPRADIDAAYEAGFRVFGESRVQEIREKFADPLPSDASLHMIGSLQTNKVRQLLPFVTCIESVDRMSLLEKLTDEVERLGEPRDVLIEVNVAGEEQKAGCSVSDAWDMSRALAGQSFLLLRGLMAMAPLVDDPELARPTFRELRRLRDEVQETLGLGLPVLSMGMSNDFPIAIQEGATHVRIGRALFGNR